MTLARGNIQGTDVTLNFDKNGQGSVLNTGSIAASGTLTVNTQSLTNQANQVDVGNLWSSVKGGYVDTTGTQVQPGGFMSAANMDLNVQTLNQIGGALQKLNADGTVDLAGTQQMLTALQQQLGGNFTQTSVSDNLHTSFTAEGGFGVMQVIEMAVAIALSVVTAGAGAALVGAAAGSLEAAVANAAFSALVSSLASDVMSGNFSLTGIAESVGVAMLTAGITNGITVNSSTGSLGVADWAKPVGGGVETLGQMAGTAPVVGTSVAQATQATVTTFSQQAMAIAAQATLEAGVQTAIKGGSYLRNLQADAVPSVGSVLANAIGTLAEAAGSIIPPGSIGYDLAHAALGCATSAALGTGCAGGAIGGAASALVTPEVLGAMDPNHAQLTTDQMAVAAGIATLAGGLAAGVLGQNAVAGATAAQNEALNNSLAHWAAQKFQELKDATKNAYNKATNAVASAYNRFSFQLPDSFVAATNAGLDVPAMESAGNLDVLKGIGNVGLNLPTLSVPGMPDYTPIFKYSNPVAGAVGEMYGLGGANALAAGLLSGGATTTLYRAVSPGEFQSIMSTGKFSFGAAGSEMKQFGFNLDEVINYADFQPDYAAVVQADIPSALLGKFNVSKAIDPFIFRSGVLTVNQQRALDLFNAAAKNIRHAY